MVSGVRHSFTGDDVIAGSMLLNHVTKSTQQGPRYQISDKCKKCKTYLRLPL